MSRIKRAKTSVFNKIFTCKICKKDNLLRDEMHVTGFHIYKCKKCVNEKAKEFRLTEQGKRHTKNRAFKYKYGITIDEYEKLLLKQNNECAICFRQFNERIRPDVDHHHGSKKVRGILCHTCNLALGYLKEDEDIIWNILEYLKRTTWSKGDSDVATV